MSGLPWRVGRAFFRATGKWWILHRGLRPGPQTGSTQGGSRRESSAQNARVPPASPDTTDSPCRHRPDRSYRTGCGPLSVPGVSFLSRPLFSNPPPRGNPPGPFSSHHPTESLRCPARSGGSTGPDSVTPPSGRRRSRCSASSCAKDCSTTRRTAPPPTPCLAGSPGRPATRTSGTRPGGGVTPGPCGGPPRGENRQKRPLTADRPEPTQNPPDRRPAPHGPFNHDWRGVGAVHPG